VERILITGASRGIGRAVALRLAKAGRELLLHGRDPRSLEASARQVRERGGQARTVVADLAQAPEVEALAAVAGGEPLAALVHNAGVAVVKPTPELTLEEWQRSLAVNVTAPFLLSRRLAPSMPAGATIVHVLSVAARQGFSGWAAYCASKFALEGFSQCLRQELRAAGVRVVNVYPSATATELWDGVAGHWPRERMLAPEQVAEAVAFAVERPGEVLVPEIFIGHVTGTL